MPDFKYLDGDLLYAAVTQGVKSPEVIAYLDSIFELVVQDGGEGSKYLAKLRSSLGEYQTTEAELLQEFAPSTPEIPRDEGLRLVRQSYTCKSCRAIALVVVSTTTGTSPVACDSNFHFWTDRNRVIDCTPKF